MSQVYSHQISTGFVDKLAKRVRFVALYLYCLQMLKAAYKLNLTDENVLSVKNKFDP